MANVYRARSSGQPEITTITFTSATTAKVERDGYYDEYQNAHYKMTYTITKQSDSTTTPDTNTTPDNPTTTAIPFTTLTGTWQASNGTGTITSGDRQGTMSLSTTHSNTITFTNASDSGSLDGTSQIYLDVYDENGTFAGEYEDEFGGGSMNFTGITFENTGGNTWVMERLNKHNKTTRTTITFTSSTTAEVERLEDRNEIFSFKYTLTKQ